MKYLLIILIAISSFGCIKKDKKIQRGKTLIEIIGTEQNGIVKTYMLDGTLISETSYKDSKVHGVKKEYHTNGQIYKETPCENGIVNGVIREYYSSGKLFKEIPTKEGKAEGTRKTYYENGKLKAIIDYSDGKALEGLKEYDDKGNLIAQPELIIKGRDKTVLDGSYIVELSISSKTKKVKYYLVTANNDKEYKLKLPVEDGIGMYSEYIPKGGIVMKKLTFEARYNTKMGNACVVRKDFSLAVSND